MRLAVLSGSREQISAASFRLKPNKGLPGFAIGGSESDAKFEVWAKTKLVTCHSASLIIDYTKDTNYKKRYVEFRVDYTNQCVSLYLMIEGESPMAVKALERAWPINLNQDYALGLRVNVDADGDFFVQCLLDDAEVLLLDYLGPVLQAGMFGFRVDGDDGDSCEFSEVLKGPYGAKDMIDKVLVTTNLTVSQVSYENCLLHVQNAVDTASSITGASLSLSSLSGDYLLLVKALAGLYLLASITGGSSSGLGFTLGPLTVSGAQSGSMNVSRVVAQLQEEASRLIDKLKPLEFRVADSG